MVVWKRDRGMGFVCVCRMKMYSNLQFWCLSNGCWYLSCTVGSRIVTNWACNAVGSVDVQGSPLSVEFWINLSKRIFWWTVFLSLICWPNFVCMYMWYFSRVSIFFPCLWRVGFSWCLGWGQWSGYCQLTKIVLTM